MRLHSVPRYVWLWLVGAVFGVVCPLVAATPAHRPLAEAETTALVKMLRDKFGSDGVASSLALLGVNHLPALPFTVLRDVGVATSCYDLDAHTGVLTPTVASSPDLSASTTKLKNAPYSFRWRKTTEIDVDGSDGGGYDFSEDTLLLSNEVTLRGELLETLAALSPNQRLILLSSPSSSRGEDETDQRDDGDGDGSDNYELLVQFFSSLQQSRHIYRLRVGNLLLHSLGNRKNEKRERGEEVWPFTGSMTAADRPYSSPMLDELVCEAMTLGVLNVHSPLFFPLHTYLLFTRPEDVLISLFNIMSTPFANSTSATSRTPHRPQQLHQDVVPYSLCVRTAFVFNQLAAYTAAPVYFHHPPLDSLAPADKINIQKNIQFGEETCNSAFHSSSVNFPLTHRLLKEQHQVYAYSNTTVDEVLQASLHRYLKNDLPNCSPAAVSQIKQKQEYQWMQQKIQSLLDQKYHVVLFSTDSSPRTMKKMSFLIEDIQHHLFQDQGQRRNQQQFQFSSGSCDLLVSSSLAPRIAVVVSGNEVDRKEVAAAIECSVQQKREQKIRSHSVASAPILSVISSVVMVLWGDNSPQALVHVLGPSPVSSLASSFSSSSSAATSSFAMENIYQRRQLFVSHNLSVHNHHILPTFDQTMQTPLVFKISKGRKHSSHLSGRAKATAVVSGGRTRSRTILLTHMRNEALLLPQWIRHNAPHFDLAILLDYNSSDGSLDIIRREAPSTWSVVQSKHDQFECKEADEELMEIERRYPNDWKIVLTLTEFLVIPSLRSALLQPHFANTTLIRFPSYLMVGELDEQKPYQSHQSLLLQRKHFGIDPAAPKSWMGLTIYSRFMHRKLSARTHYGSGRHFMLHDGELLTDEGVAAIAMNDQDDSGIVFKSMRDEGFITKYKWTPWPETIPRNAQIYSRISYHDRQVGTPHIYNGAAALTARREEIFKTWFIENFESIGTRSDVLSDMRLSMHKIWLETTQQAPIFHDNLQLLKNVSDVFELSILIGEDEQRIQLSMLDLLASSSPSSGSLSRDVGRFCREHVAAYDVDSCQETVVVFAHRWVMEANLY